MQDREPTRWQWLSDEVLANEEPNDDRPSQTESARQPYAGQSPQTPAQLWRWINDNDIRLTGLERSLRALILVPISCGIILLLLTLNHLLVNLLR